MTVELLRTLLAARTESEAQGVEIGTRTPHGTDKHTRTNPFVMVRLDRVALDRNLDESATVRVTVWHASEAKSLALAQLCRGLLLAYMGDSNVRAYQALAGPIPAGDPESGEPLSFFTVAARLRPTSKE